MVTSFFFDVGPEPVVGSWIAASLGPSSTPLTFSNQRNSSIRPPASRPSAPAARNHRRVETRLSAPTFASNGELDPQFRVTELVKPEKIVWRVLDDSTTDFVQDQTE